MFISVQSLTFRLPASEVFGPWELLDALNKEKQTLGLIIDLTYTKRYYTPQVRAHTQTHMSLGADPCLMKT